MKLSDITTSIAQYDYAAAIEKTVRLLAIAIAFTYAAGYTAGALIHSASSQLAAFWRELHTDDWHERRLAHLRQRLSEPPPQPPAAPTTPITPTPPPAARPTPRKRSSAKPRSGTRNLNPA